MTCSDVLKITVENWGLTVAIGPVLFITAVTVIAGLLAYFLWKRPNPFKSYEIECIELPLISGGKVSIKPNREVIRIAYQAYVELATRKAAIRFKRDDDVIAEVYDSWYKLFKTLRELAKSVPADRLRGCEDTQKLVELLLAVLNKGLRPHLTQWQARFRGWYSRELEKSPDRDPQSLQQDFPKYEELVEDLDAVSDSLAQLTECLRKIAHGE